MKNYICSLLILLIIGASSTINAQQVKGVIIADDGPLPGVTIYMDSLKLGTATDLDGNFSIQTGKEGKYQVKISYVGFKDKIIDFQINAGINDLGNILLETNDLILGEVVVSGTMAPSQAKAYNIKKNSIAMLDVVASDAVGKLPDRNAAEAVQRIQGVAVARYHGEADQATVRGTPFAWTSTLFNGSRLPSSNVMGNRSSVLDAIPSELIQYVQVAKALTPDWEGDAIGGSVNFITRTAPLKRKLGVSLAGGYNDFSENATYNGSVVYGDRFLNDKLGIILVGAIWDRKWGSDSYDVKYNTGEAAPTNENEHDIRNSINNIMFKRYMGKRQTYGINLGTEYKFNNEHKIYFRGLYDKFNDIRPVYESYIDYNKNGYQYNYRYSYYQTELFGGEVGGEHQLSQKIMLDWAASDYKAEYFLDTPPTSGAKGLPIATFTQKLKGKFGNLSGDGRYYWGFDSPDGVGGNPMDFSAKLTDATDVMSADKLELSQLVISQLDNEEHDRTFQANIKIEQSPKLSFKAGGKFRTKSRESKFGSNIVYVSTSPDKKVLSDFQREDFPLGHGFFKEMKGDYSQYIMEPLTKNQLFDLYRPDFLDNNGFVDYTSKTNPTNLYSATENVYAAYIMADYQLTEKLRLVGGFRNEYTTTTLKGTQATTSTENPSVPELADVKTKNNYNALLPMFHLKYSINDKSNLRAAYTRTFVRPNFGDMTPGESIDNTKNPITITKGNKNLDPTFADNFDVMGEYFFDNVGLLSGGFFYKNIKDVIFNSKSYYNEGGNSYVLSQARNLKNARLFGFEVGINKRFDFLNGFWSGFGVELNYTYIDSKVKVPRQVGTGNNAYIVNDESRLPDQSKNMANAILFYEKGIVMVRLAGNFRGESIYSINQDLGKDFYVWTANNFTVDASATVNIMKNLKCFVELNNLTNEPLKQYMGDSRRLTTSEWYGIKGQVGFRWDIF